MGSGFDVGGGKIVKSVQRGTGTWSTTSGDTFRNITISPVDPEKSYVIVSYVAFNSDSIGARVFFTNGKLTSSTVLRLEREIRRTDETANFTWQVIEFENVKSFQSGTHLHSPASAGYRVTNTTISNIDLSKSFVFATYRTTTTTVSNEAILYYRLSAENNIEFATRSPGSGFTHTVEWVVIEF